MRINKKQIQEIMPKNLTFSHFRIIEDDNKKLFLVPIC
jgi:hypothetical protein